MTTKRVDIWPLTLGDTIKQSLTRPFEWGRFDCCLFALECNDACTGSFLYDRFAGTYDSEYGAARVLQPYGGIIGIADAVYGEFGWPQVPPLTAQRGDTVSMEVPDGTGQQRRALGIVGLSGRDAFFAGPQGVVALPLRDCDHAWRIAE